MQESSVFAEAVSEERLFNVVKEVSGFHRIQASPMFREAAEHVLKICERYGLNARILSYEADPSVWHLQSRSFREWSISEGYLDLADPEMRLSDYSAEPISVIQKSHPIDRRDDPVELVLLDKGNQADEYKDIDLSGRFVFIRGHIREYDWVYDKGALGVVTDFIMETEDRKRSDLYDSVAYTSYWPTFDEGEAEKRGFVLSPRAGDMLADLCRKQYENDASYLKVRPYINSSFYNGRFEVVEAEIPGKDDKTVYLCAHLCHPKRSCNDNASGVSATIEAMNVIQSLVREGKIEPPLHTIKLTLIPEYTGTFAYLSDHTDYQKGLGAMNLDMVGGRQGRSYGPITLTRTPYQTPSLINEMCLFAMDQASREASSLDNDPVALTNHCTAPHTGGSDHTIYCDPTINIPCCMLGQWPDMNYHTSTDTPDKIDPAVLKFSCLTAVNFAYGLAMLNEEDLPYLFNKQEAVMIEDKNRFTLEYLSGKIDKAMFGSLMFYLKDYYMACCDTASRLVEGYDAAKEKQHVADFFDSWISFYDLSDDYPLDGSLDTVYRRKFTGPVQKFTDYRSLGYGDVVDEYLKQTPEDIFPVDPVSDLVTNLIDGKNTAGEIVRKASLEKRKDVKKEVLLLLKLYEDLDLTIQENRA